MTKITKEFSSDADVILHHGKAESFLEGLPENFIRLVISSPPYNLGKDYEEKKPFEEHISDIGKIISSLHPKVIEGGSICWQVGNYVEDGEIFPLDFHYYTIFKALGYKLRNRIVWHFGHGHHAQNRFSGRYETILWFTKGNDYIFNLDPVRVPAKYPGKKRSRGSKKGQLSGNPKGKNPSDIWNIPNVKANHIEKTSHPCQFPVALVERCLLALTTEGDTVFDPICGVASTLIERGVEMVVPPTSFPDAGRRLIFIQDNNGNFIEFLTPLSELDGEHGK